MKPALIILRPDNAGALARLHASGFDRAWSVEFIRELLERSDTLALGIELETGIAAFILIQMTPETGDILTLTTAHDHRRKGLARQLLRAALSRMGERGISRLLLEVAADNLAAIALYESLGFERGRRRRKYYDRGYQSRVDAVQMSRTVAGQMPG